MSFTTLHKIKRLNHGEHGEHGESKSSSNANQPVFQNAAVEINQQTDPDFRYFQISKHLRPMDRQQSVHRVEFNDHAILDEQIKPKATINSHILVCNTNSLLSFEQNTGVCQ